MTVKNNLQPPIYLDYHATTPVDPRVAKLMLHYMTTEFGNASSTDHVYGDRAAKAVSQARSQVAELVGASAREVIFTSGAVDLVANFLVSFDFFSTFLTAVA